MCMSSEAIVDKRRKSVHACTKFNTIIEDHAEMAAEAIHPNLVLELLEELEQVKTAKAVVNKAVPPKARAAPKHKKPAHGDN